MDLAARQFDAAINSHDDDWSCSDDSSQDDVCDCGECRVCIESAVRDSRRFNEAQS